MSITLQNLVEKYIGFSSNQRGDEYHYHCPQCGWKNPRFIVNYDLKKFHCWKCGYGSSNLIKLLKDLKASDEDVKELYNILGKKLNTSNLDINSLKEKIKKELNIDNTTSVQYRYLKLPEYFVPLIESKDKSLKRGVERYLHSRDVSDYEINYYNVHINEQDRRIVFLTYETSKYPVFYVERSFENGNKFFSMPKSVKKTDIIFFEHLLDFKKEILITEGVFDAIKLGFNGVPLLGTAMNKKLLNRMVQENTPSVTIALDTDAQDKAMYIAQQIIRKGIKVRLLNDKSFKDVGEMSKEHIMNLLQKTTYLTKEEIIETKLKSI